MQVNPDDEGGRSFMDGYLSELLHRLETLFSPLETDTKAAGTPGKTIGAGLVATCAVMG